MDYGIRWFWVFVGAATTFLVVLVLMVGYSITVQTIKAEAIRTGFIEYQGAHFAVTRADLKLEPWSGH